MKPKSRKGRLAKAARRDLRRLNSLPPSLRFRRRFEPTDAGGYWEELPEPIFRGYERFLVLKDHMKDDNTAQRLLALVNHRQFCPRKDFLKRDPKTSKWVEMGFGPKSLDEKEISRVPEELKRFFHIHFETHTDHHGRERSLVYYHIASPEIFRVQKEKKFSTHRWVPNNAVERDRAHLERHLFDYGEAFRMENWSHRSGWDKLDRAKLAQNKAKKKDTTDLD